MTAASEVGLKVRQRTPLGLDLTSNQGNKATGKNREWLLQRIRLPAFRMEMTAQFLAQFRRILLLMNRNRVLNSGFQKFLLIVCG
jgi:hypothetical protein